MFGLSGVYGLSDSGCTAGSHPNDPLLPLAAGLAAVMGWVTRSLVQVPSRTGRSLEKTADITVLCCRYFRSHQHYCWLRLQ